MINAENSTDVKRGKSAVLPKKYRHAQPNLENYRHTCDVQLTLMRTSWALGGATSTSSMDRGFPGSHATAALQLIT